MPGVEEGPPTGPFISGVASAAEPIPAAPTAAPLGERAARGVAWMVLQGLGSKIIAIAGQVALAWLLGRKDFGQVGLAYAIFGFASILQQSGLREILVQRHRHLRRWENAAFWMSLAGGLLSAVFMLAAAPAASVLFESPRLTGLVAVLSLTGPIAALAIVPTSRLQIDLRFRYLSIVNIVSSTATVLLNVLFAYLGFGAYSFILPLPIVAALRTVLLLAAAPPAIRLRFQFRRWRYLVGDSGLAIASVVCIVVSMQGDYLILGYRYGDEQVGLYFFAFNLSSQTMQLLAANIAGVLFPTLSKLQMEPRRQCHAFVRASRLSAVLGVPFCLIQAAVAAPAFALLFDPKWQASVQVFQVLSLGMASLTASIAAGSMMQAQGRFRLLFFVSFAFAALFIAAVWIAASVGQARAVAVAVAIYTMVTGPLNIYFAIRPVGGGWKQVCEVYVMPFLAAALATAVPYLLIRHVVMAHYTGVVRNWTEMLLIGLLTLAIYLPLVRYFMPADWNELLGRARGFLRTRATP